MDRLRDLLGFIIIVAICFFIWNNQKKHEPIKESAPQITAAAKAPVAKNKSVRLLYKFNIKLSSPNAKTATLTIPVPANNPSKQTIKALKLSHKTSQIYMSDDTKYAKIEFIAPKKTAIEVTMAIDSILHTYDYKYAESQKRNSEKLPNRSRYLKAEKNIEVNSQTIKSAAASIKGQSQIDTLTNINNYLTQKVRIVDASKTIGAEQSLKNGSAGISDYLNLFVALARAKGYPARIASGYIVGVGGSSRHAWAEVYFSEYGWVTFDIMNTPVDITELNSFYIKSANNSFMADSLETTFDNIPTNGRVETYMLVNAQ